MEQRREWREKSGGVLEGVEIEDVEEVSEVGDGAEDVGKIDDGNSEGSLKIGDGADVAGAAVVWTIA
jgi:hypothetical protein